MYAVHDSKLLLLDLLLVAMLMSISCGGRPGAMAHARPEAPVVGGGTSATSQAQSQTTTAVGNGTSVAQPEVAENGSAVTSGTQGTAPHAQAVTVTKNPVTEPAKQHSVSLNWGRSTSSVMGYYIYRALSATGPFTKLNSQPEAATFYYDTTVVAGKIYYYAITAINTEGESVRSNVVKAAIPSP